MKQGMVCLITKKSSRRYQKENILPVINAQIHNSLDLGWDPKNIILLTNFDYEFMGVKARYIEPQKVCLTGSKMSAIQHIFKNKLSEETVWMHDLEAWANIYFDEPEMKDIGISCYSKKSKLNGGSIFFKPSSVDIIDEIVKDLIEKKRPKEEISLNKILKCTKYINSRVTLLNETFCVGCSGYYPRFLRSLKPVRVCHFWTCNRIAVETQMLDRDGMAAVSVSKRLEHVLRKYFPDLATEISLEGKKRSEELRKKHLSKVY